MPPSRRRRPPRQSADLPPLRILRSILLLQLSYYFTSLLLVGFTTFIFGQPFSLGLILDWRTVRGDNTVGWVLGGVGLLTGFVTIIPLLFLISRSKLIPDFALTIHLLHLIITTLYTRSPPLNLLWWGLQAASAALMVALGVWVCRYRELKPITFGLGDGTKVKKGQTQENGDPGGGFVRGGATGGRREGGGPSYEMVEQGGKEGVDNNV